MNKLVALILTVATTLGLGFAVSPATAHAQSAAQIACETAGGTYSGTTCSTASGQRDVGSAVRTAVNILSFVAGAVAIIMVVVGGIKYVTSGGDANAVGSAKNTILYAVVGLVIALLAQALVRFVFGKAT